MEAQRIADSPIVELPAPSVHLARREPPRFGNESGQKASLVPARFPKRLGQLVMSAEALGEYLDLGHRDAEGSRRLDSVSRQAVPVAFGAVALEPLQRLGDLALERLRRRLAGWGCRRGRSRCPAALPRWRPAPERAFPGCSEANSSAIRSRPAAKPWLIPDL